MSCVAVPGERGRLGQGIEWREGAYQRTLWGTIKG